MSAPIDKLVVEIRAETKKLREGLDNVNKRLDKTAKKSGVAKNALKGFGAIVATIGVAKLAQDTVNTIRTFEDLEATLRAVTGGAQNAAMSFDLIRKFTATTTFQVEEVADAFIRLKQAGVTPTSEVLQDFGNLAAGMGRSITQLAQAAFNATTGEMEMLKQFGVIARIDGDKIRATFNGITTEIGRSGDEVIEFLRSIGREEFPTAISERANTLTGAISNLQDSVSEFFVAIGEGGLKDALTDLAKRFKKILDDSRPVAHAIGNVLGKVFQLLGIIIGGVLDNLHVLAAALAGLTAIGIVSGLVMIVDAFRRIKTAIDMATASSTMFQSITLGPVGIAKVLAGAAAAVTAFVVINDEMEKMVANAGGATDEMEELNKELLDAMPMNAKNIDLVSESVRKLAEALGAMKAGTMNLNEVLLLSGGDISRFMQDIDKEIFKAFQQKSFSKTTPSGQKANILAEFFRVDPDDKRDIMTRIIDLAGDMELDMKQVFGPDGFFKDIGDAQIQAGEFLTDNIENIYDDLFKMNRQKLQQVFGQILDIPQVESLMGGVQKILRDSLGDELDGIDMLLGDENKLAAFFEAAQVQGYFLGFTLDDVRAKLKEYKTEVTEVPDPFENLTGFDKLFFDTLEDATESTEAFKDQLVGLTDQEILEKLQAMPEILAKFGFATANEALPHITKLRDSLTDLDDVLSALHGDFENQEEVFSALNAAMADGNITIEQANELYREFLESLGPTGQAMATIGREIEGIADSFAEDFTNALLTGEDALESFRNFAQQIVQSIISEFLRLLVIRPIVDAALGALGMGTGTSTPTPSGGGGTGFGTFASGGKLQAGRPYMVGERGAEMFVPDASGTLYNNMNTKKAMGGGTPIVVNQSINFATGVVPTVRHEVTKMMPQIAEVTKAAVAEQASRGGNFRKMLGGG